VRIAHSFVLLSALVVVPVLATPSPSVAPQARVIQIEVGDNMKFAPATITAAPGESIKVVLKGVGKMPKVAMGHNFVLLRKGVDPKKLVDVCASAADTEYIAASVTPQLLSYTRLIGPGETADAPFTAPAVPGDYAFVCTFPGHFALGMKGVLTVK
jgi:azurin